MRTDASIEGGNSSNFTKLPAFAGQDASSTRRASGPASQRQSPRSSKYGYTSVYKKRPASMLYRYRQPIQRDIFMPSPIEFYFDFISPYGYFGSTQIGPLAARYGRSVDWKPVLLGVTVLKVMGLKPLMETPLKSDYIRHDKPRLARLLDIPFADHGIPAVNPINAARAFLWLKAQDSELAVLFAQRIYRRLWVDGRDITLPEASAEEAESLGVDRARLLQALTADEIKNALRLEVQAAIDRGVFGTPWFIADGEPLWGVDRIWMLEHWLRHRSWEPAKD